MTNYIACSLLFAMASLTNITVASSVFLQRRIAAFSSVARNRNIHRQQHRRRPSAVPLPLVTNSNTMQQRHSDQRYSISRSQFTSRLFITIDDDNSAENRTTANIPLLKKEIARLTLRTHKKIDKASTRIRGAEEQYNKLRLAIDACPSDYGVDDKLLQQLEQAPSVELYKQELRDLQDRLQKLNWLQEQLNKSPLKNKKELSFDEILNIVPNEGAQVTQYILDLDISDDYESQRQKKIEMDANNRLAKKEKSMKLNEHNVQQPKQGGRLPYRRYYSQQQTEIRVCKSLSCSECCSTPGNCAIT